MGFLFLLSLAIVATWFVVLIRDLWRTYKKADREWRLAKADERFAREHRIGQ